MDQEKFEFSNHPNYLQWYQCYNDLASKDWLDGIELRSKKDSWDERAIAKWNFFYRPVKPVVGRPQKKMISERRAAIEVSKAEIEQARKGVTEQRERIRKETTQLAIVGGALVIMSLWFVTITVWLLIIPLLGAIVALSHFEKNRRDASRIIRDLEAKVALHNGIIQKNEKEIGFLEEEIRFLVKQIPDPVNAEVIESWLREEIAAMELACLSEFVGRTVTPEDVQGHLSQDFGDPRVKGLLIDSWGFLQPTSLKGPLGWESTGLGRATEDLRHRVATWQVGSDSSPIFRLLFIQYIFPLKRNLNICSFFYDFVSRRTYGKRLETFQYNHVTNYSIREIESETEHWVQESGLTTMSGLLRGKTLRALTIAVSSGNHFRCVLVDDDVVEVLNMVLKQEEKYRELEESLLNDLEIPSGFKGDKRRTEEWQAREKARIETELKEVVREKRQVHWTSRTSKVLGHVRNCVEEYIHRFQEAVSMDGAPGN
jgi:hypothetical protein